MSNRCTLCPRFSAAPLCQRCGEAVSLHAASILHGAAVQLAEHLRRHAEEQDRQAIEDLDRAVTLPPGKVTGDAPEPVTTGDLAAGGRQGSQARDLLAKAERQGQRLLHTLLKASLTRLLTSGPSRLILARSLFTDEERKQLTEGLAGVLAPANLLGRARVRKRLSPTTFADPDIRPMPPEKALDYFRGLVPGITGDPQRFGPDMRRRAFTLAVSTEKGLLDRVKGVLANSLESGEATTSTSRQVQDLLDRAGVSPRNPSYALMVTRTNIGEALNQGQQEEFDDPDLADLFPVFRYDGVLDGRERAGHRIHFGKYFPRSVTFAQVRDSATGGRFSAWNCRCTMTPIDSTEWDDLQAQGARVEPGWGPTDAPGR